MGGADKTVSPLRVGMVSPYDLTIPGGVQAQVLGLSRYLAGRGDRPLVIGPGLPEGVEGVDLGASFSVPGNGSMVPISIDPRVRDRIRSAVEDVQLLHVHEPLMPLVSLFATRAGPPVVATFHAAPGRMGHLAYSLGRPILRTALGRTVIVTAVSRIAASVLPESIHARIIPNGLDVASLQADVARDPMQVAFLGRDEARKGLDVLLDAWGAVKGAQPGARLVVIGAHRDDPGPVWMGRVDDATKAEVLSASAVYVAPNTGGESFGIVVVEGMAAGAAVVASDLPPFRAVAGGAARFFPTGDSRALARAVIDLLSNPERRHELAVAGSRVAAGYDWTVVGAAYREAYLEALS
jgi:phosphatidylinositol alpha-mannosyltransferase